MSNWPLLQRSFRRNSVSGAILGHCGVSQLCHHRRLIVSNFIPVAEVEKVKGRAVLSAETDEWTLTPVQASEMHVPRPVSRVGSFRPMSSSARMAAATGNPRYMVCVY